ncbi:MAG: YqgE/AlgH family protein [Muribaculaceae bacterium]|nr:YqgE/AlgH family protein [Muribaculaceae bacterium]
MKNIKTSFLDISTLKVPVHTGDLLVAQPFLQEEWFNRAVITVIDHSAEEGTTGAVLNLPIQSTLSEVLDGVTREEPVPVYCGGPLSQDRLFFVHTLGDSIIPDARQYAPGQWIGGDFAAAIDYVNQGYPIDGMLRFFVGYSGWTPGQLDEEIEADTWAVQSDAASAGKLLEGAGDAYWHRIVRSLGSFYRHWLMIPQDIRSN